jgi:hypothetical protein
MVIFRDMLGDTLRKNLFFEKAAKVSGNPHTNRLAISRTGDGEFAMPSIRLFRNSAATHLGDKLLDCNEPLMKRVAFLLVFVMITPSTKNTASHLYSPEFCMVALKS